jgi:hypothetical protein
MPHKNDFLSNPDNRIKLYWLIKIGQIWGIIAMFIGFMVLVLLLLGIIRI